jgi:hypothetical protein
MASKRNPPDLNPYPQLEASTPPPAEAASAVTAGLVPSTNGTPVAPDPYDVETLRLPQGPRAAAGVRKLLTNLPCRKPDKSWFVRCHPSEAYRITVGVLDLKEDREIYLIAAPFRAELETEPTYAEKTLALAINRQGDPFLWEVTLPREANRKDTWGRSALEAMDLATRKWVRVASNMSAKAYDIYEAVVSLPEPQWPDLSLRDLLRLSFRDHTIDSVDHPVWRRLRGEV